MIEVQYVLMIDYLGVDGVWGSEKRQMPNGTTEEQALKHARGMLRDHAGRVELFRREIDVDWERVEDLRR